MSKESPTKVESRKNRSTLTSIADQQNLPRLSGIYAGPKSHGKGGSPSSGALGLFNEAETSGGKVAWSTVLDGSEAKYKEDWGN